MTPPLTYSPYQGYHYAHPGLWYSLRTTTPKRIRTRNGWWYPREKRDPDHWTVYKSRPWQNIASRSGGARFQKHYVHRKFRLLARAAIREALTGDPDAVSHAFYVSGDYLD